MTPEQFSNPVDLARTIAREPLFVTPATRVVEAIAHMSEARKQCAWGPAALTAEATCIHEAQTSCVLVIEDGQLVGIMTERDVVRLSASGADLREKTVAEVMAAPVITLKEQQFTDIFVAANLFQRHRIRHLPLVDERQQVMGLLTHESLQYLFRPVDLLRFKLVSEVMHSQIIWATPEEPIQILAQRMTTHRVSSVVIVTTDPGQTGDAPPDSSDGSPMRPVGLVTERDIVQFYALGLDFATVPARTVMSCPLFTVESQASLWEVHTLMQERRLSRVVVTDQRGALAGIVTQSTLLQTLNPIEICRLVGDLESQVKSLEAEKLALLQSRNQRLEKEVEQRTEAIQQQIEREQVLRTIGLRIRASLDVETTLQTVVHEVRGVLDCDRTLIYQFAPDWSGTVTAESVAPEWPAISSQTIVDPCFQQDAKILYQRGQRRAIANIYEAGYRDCYIQTLEAYQVKANLVVPILVKEQLWGLLLAHHCRAFRQWATGELKLLDDIALQVAVAIQQAELYEREQAALHSLQRLNRELEDRIEQSTIELRNSEARFRRLFDQNPVGIAVSTLEGRITRVNASLQRILSCSEVELLERHIDDFLTQATPMPPEQGLTSATREMQLQAPDQPPIWVNLTSSLIIDAFGEPLEVVHLIEDISQRKQAETDLNHYIQEVEDLYNNAPCGYHSLDSEGRFIRINDTELHWLGYPREAVIGRAFHDFLTPESQRQFAANYGLFKQNGRVKDLEFELINQSGEVLPVLLNSTAVMDAAGHYRYSRTTMVDMRDRKRAQLKLQTLSENLQLALKAGDIGMWEWDIENNQTFWDSRMYELYGITDPHFEVSHRAWLACIHPDDRERILPPDHQGCSYQQDFELEFRIILPDGKQRFIKDYGLLQRNAAGAVARIVGINLDITRQKQVELALQESEQKFRQLAENIDGVFWVRDLTGTILYISPGYETIWQRSQTDLLQNPASWLAALHPDDRERVLAVAQSNVAFDHEYRILLPDGTLRWIRDRGFQVANAQGEVYRLAGIAEDISAQKHHAAEQQIVEETLRSQLNAIEAAIDGIAILSGNTYTYLNQAHLQMFGYQHAAELIGQNWQQLYSEAELARFEAEVFPVLIQKRYWQGEAIATRKDGTTFTEGLSLTLTDHGELICVCRDITAQKQAAKQLQQTNEQLILSNAELARATRLKDEFLANMSHELRTPLNAILGMTEGLQDEVFGPLSQGQQRAAATIERSGKHLLALINDILDLAKIESGKLELQLAPVAVTYLCESSLTFVRQQAIQKKIALGTQIPDALPDLVGDELRLRQVLINLLSNAIKFTPEGGRVTLAVSTQAAATGHSIQFTIEDTGIGIAPEHLDQLFQPFVQIDSSLTRQHAGTGLGLSLVRQLVTLHDGTVNVTSTEGQGSCFTVQLPYTQPASPSPPLASSLADSSHRDRPSQTFTPQSPPLILLAEDNPANIATLSGYLEKRGFRLVVAHNGHEAVTLSASCQPDLMIIDIQMPQLDGLSAMRQIRAHPTTASTPIIALTALAMASDRENCLAAGANDYLTKPVRLKTLVEVIQRLLQEVSP